MSFDAQSFQTRLWSWEGFRQASLPFLWQRWGGAFAESEDFSNVFGELGASLL